MGVWMGAIAERLREVAAEEGCKGPGAWTWPNAEYRDDPVRFCRIELGVDLVDYAVELAEAVRDDQFTAVRGGRKVSKDFTLACIAWWFFCSFPGARVRFTAVNGDQVRDVFWREIRMRWAESGRCLDCKRSDPDGPKPCPHAHPIREVPATLPATGVRSEDFREIVGTTASSEEGAAGVSGAYQLYIVDEASDVDEFVFEAIDGNIGGCVMARVVMLSNPTRNLGRFFDAFHSKEASYRKLHWSSRNSPNVRAGRLVVPGLATREWIDSMIEIYGKESQWVTIHIDGDFVKNAEGTVFPLEMIDASFARWATAPDRDEGTDELQIGVDVAGAGDRSDDSGFAARRGRKMLEVSSRAGLDPDTGAHVVEILGLIATYRSRPDEPVRVCIDREGEQGAKVWRRLQEYLVTHPDAFVLVGVRASERAQRDPRTFERVRDELAASLADWLREGGALPAGAKLRAELNAFRWIPQPSGRSRLLPKPEMRKLLGRSPDRADATMLATWRPVWNADAAPPAPPTETEAYGGTFARGEGLDPYAANDWWRSR